MNTEELKVKLDELKIPESYYSINNSIGSDKHILRKVHNYWECFYIDERGGENGYHQFDSEQDACDYFLKELKAEIC